MSEGPAASRGTPSPGSAIARLLTFRLTHEEFVRLGPRHLALALACTWVVGMGRWWDDPGARLVQQLGLGSVAYAFVLSGLLWLLIAPFRGREVGYMRVLSFVAMTSPPGILYAIPVERCFDLETAGRLNLWFLAAVALWRVGLLGYFLYALARLRVLQAIAVTLLPLTAIVASLFALNLHRVVFRLMGSIAESERTAHDVAYGVLFLLTTLSTVAAPLLLLLWLTLGGLAWNERRKARSPGSGGAGG